MLEIFQYQFMQRALLAGLAVGLIAPLIGSFLVVRRQSLFADTLAHVALLGVAIGVLTGSFPLLMAVATSTLGGLGMALLYVRRKVLPEAILALFLYGSLALAVIIMSAAKSFNVSLLTVLFGSLLTVQQNELYAIAVLSIVSIAIVAIFYRQLFFISFDEEVAKVSGLPVTMLTIILMVLAAVVVSLSIRIIGALLIGALMVIPALAAMQFRFSFHRTVLLAIVFSLVSVLVGLILSFFLGLASGGMIVMVAVALFAVAALINRSS